jgi:hypothetical protein
MISGKFLADFESFYTACAKAEISLKAFESGAGTVETKLNKMADSFSGRKIVQEATLMAKVFQDAGGAAAFTEAELSRMGAVGAEAAEKLRVLGKDVPAGIQKIAAETRVATTAHDALRSTVKELALEFAAMFTVERGFEFLKNVVEQASALKNLSQQTQINVVDLQVLAGATRTFGIDADTLGKGLYTLARNIAGGDASVVTGLHLMGLSLKDVENLHGKELFLKVMDGLSTLQGGLRDTAAADVFGSRIGAALAGASKGMRAAMEDASRLNTVMGKESVEALEQYDTAIKRAETNLSALAANALGPLAEGFNTLNEAAAKGASKWAIFWAMVQDAGTSLGTFQNAEHLATLLDHLNVKAEAAAAATKHLAGAHHEAAVALTEHQQAARFMATLEQDAGEKLDAWQVKNLAHLKEIGALNAANAAAIGVNATQFEKYRAEQEASAAATKKMADAMTELHSAGVGWQGTMATINGTTLEAVRGYLAAGVSQDALATAYKLTAAQVKSVTQFMADQVAQQKLNDAAILVTTQLWDAYDALRVEHGGTATDQQIAQIDRWAADVAAQTHKAGTDTVEFYDALVAVSAEKMNAIRANWGALTEAASTDSKAGLQQIADKAAATFAIALTHVGEWSEGTIRKFQDTAIAAQKAADDWGQSFDGALNSPALSGAAATAAGTIKEEFTATFNSVSAGADAMANHVAAVLGALTQTDAYRKAGFFVSPGFGTAETINASALRGIGKTIPAYAGGTNYAPGGAALVGERGPELINLPKGSRVTPNGGWGGVTVNIGAIHASGAHEGRAAADAIVAQLKAKGIRI